LSSGLIDAASCTDYNFENKRQIVPDSAIGDLKYLTVECSGSLTVATLNQSPFLIIWGDGNAIAWGLPDLIRKLPLMVKCVGN
jgi:hypothetical protein